MRCLYINLDSAPERRAKLEASFAAHAPAHWSIERIPAVSATAAAAADGSIKPAAKGCFLSHIEAIRRSTCLPGDVLIVEDDAKFGPRSFKALELLATTQTPWDLLFANADIRGAPEWLWFVRQYPELRRANNYALKDLAQIRFAGTLAYVVRDAAKRRVLEALNEAGFDLPYDLRLDDFFRRGVLKGALSFPFVVGMSDEAQTSQIDDTSQLSHRRIAARYVFRHLWFVDSEPADYAAAVNIVEQAADPAARAAGAALAVLLTPDAAR